MAVSSPDQSSTKPAKHLCTWRARLVALALGSLVFFVIPELVVRWINPPRASFRTIVFGDPVTSPKLFVKDTRLGWALRPGCDLRFMGRRVITNSGGFRGPEIAEGSRRVLCLGDSTTFGWGVGQDESFAAQLSKQLNTRDRGDRRWQVINAGVPAYSSCQIRVAADELIARWRPEFVIVCTGNNEAWPVERSDASIYLNRNPIVATVSNLLGASRLLSWLAQMIIPDRAKPYRAPPARLAVPRVSESETQENLSAIDAAARRQGARLIVVSPTVNLFHPPIERELLRAVDTVDHRADPDAPPSAAALKELARWRADHQAVEALLDEKRFDEALGAARRLRAAHPDDFRYVWLEGIALSASGAAGEGQVLMNTAFQQLPFPDRARLSCRTAIAETARLLAAPYIDANERFADAALPRLPLGYYLDWCHPSPAGHAIIASSIADVIMSSRDEGSTELTGR